MPSGPRPRTSLHARRVGLVCVLAAACSAALAPTPVAAATPGEAAPSIGRSTVGRPISLHVAGDRSAPVRMLVVGSVHGDEAAGIAIARRLLHVRVPDRVGVWVVDDLNPDGTAAGTRQNARGVDLNRNFPFAWRPLGPRGTRNHAGAGPASEPETRAAIALVAQVRPTISVWFHQPLDLVDRSGGRASLPSRYAELVGMRATRLARYPGSATRWQNNRFPGSNAFVVELPPGRLSAAAVSRHARALMRLAAEVSARTP